MKKIMLLGLFALAAFIGVSQPLLLKEANALLVFPNGPAPNVSTVYSIPDLKIYTDAAGIGQRIVIDSELRLLGFYRSQEISTNVYDFIKPLKPDITIQPTKPQVTPDYVVTGGQVNLNIPGYSDVSEIILADASLKLKDPNRLNIQLATHSISLGENLGGKRSMVNYRITDQTGKTWVQVIQKQSTVEGRLGGSFGNNHPDKQYIAGLSEDCNIYLPLQNIYTIEIENLGDLVVDFWVHFPWSSDGQERRLHREDVAPEGVRRRYYNIDPVQLGLASMTDYKRTIKINVNGKL
jgi:hypothetical protein